MINYLTENSYSRIRVGISAKRYRIQSVRLLCGSGLELQNAVAARYSMSGCCDSGIAHQDAVAVDSASGCCGSGIARQDAVAVV